MAQQMKKRLFSAALAVLLALSPLPAQAAEPGESGDDEAALSSLASVVLHPGGQTVLTALSGSGYDWRVDDVSIVDFTRKNGASATVVAKRPGRTTVWVFYTAVKDGLVQYPDGSFRPGTETYATNERWEIAVVPEGTSTGPETEKYGTVGEDVSGALSDIGLYNPALDLMPVRQEETGLWGYADGAFRLVIPFQFDWANGFITTSGGKSRADVRIGEGPYNRYVIDETGGYVISSGHESFQIFDNRILGKLGAGKRYDIDGNQIEFSAFSDLWDKDDARIAAIAKNRTEDSEDWGMHWTCLAGSGSQWLFENRDTGQRQYVKRLADGMEVTAMDTAAKGTDGNQGACGEWGLIRVIDGNGRYGAIDVAAGALVIPCEYDTLCYPSYPSGGYLAYKRGGEFGLMRNPLHPPENTVRVKGFASGNTAGVVSLADPGGFLRRCGTVYAASFQQGQLKSLALGRLDGGEAAFEEALPAGWKLFFLDAAHAPVCKEAVLE